MGHSAAALMPSSATSMKRRRNATLPIEACFIGKDEMKELSKSRTPWMKDDLPVPLRPSTTRVIFSRLGKVFVCPYQATIASKGDDNPI